MKNSVDIKILHICFADAKGGAYIGAYRLHSAMIKYGFNSRLFVVNKFTDDPTVEAPLGKLRTRLLIVQKKLSALLLQIFHPTRNRTLRSLNIIPSGLGKIINKYDADIVQLHWINNGTLSIGEISCINKPVVWKTPDMWPFSGAEHYMLPGDNKRYIEGYTRSNKPSHEWGPDVNKWVWKYKKKLLGNKNITFVGPSKWLQSCIKESSIFNLNRAFHIINPIDVDTFSPQDKNKSRREFGLPLNKSILIFGASNATDDERKGFEQLSQALEIFSENNNTDDIEIVIFGTNKKGTELLFNIKTTYVGKIFDESRLARLYSAGDVFVCPSLLDSLALVIIEASACGLPCVAFKVAGLIDGIEHKKTGYLAEPYEPLELSKGIEWVLQQESEIIRNEVRRQAEYRHDARAQVEKYIQIYTKLLEQKMND